MSHPSFRAAIRSLHACAALALFIVASFVAPATFAAGASSASSVDVDITKFAFAPQEITIAPGTRITWTNRDEAPHTVTSNDRSFTSKGLDTGDKFEHTFAAEGDFTYICTLHPFMAGVVHVREQ
ncbi:MAG: cupredoxin family copper-binding protein [Burkholderiales bacterium]|nr:cupredoxin family copper-binding protein [Burkholderiales bacterium]